jgi:hypothetical protein
MDERRKLPQSRYYLRAARYGIDALVREQPLGEDFLFYTVGILSSLRAVQHVLINHDSKLSPQHAKAIAKWKDDAPFDAFIKPARDQILKEGQFPAYARKTEFGWGEGEDYQITGNLYRVMYYSGEEQRDLIKEMRRAADWCDEQLSTIEAQVPTPGSGIGSED